MLSASSVELKRNPLYLVDCEYVCHTQMVGNGLPPVLGYQSTRQSVSPSSDFIAKP